MWAKAGKLPEPVLGLRHGVRQRHRVRLVRRGRRGEREEVVPLLGGDLGIGAGPDLTKGEMVDLDGDPIAIAPRPGELPIEPLVVRGDEVRPLRDAQHGPGGMSAAGRNGETERGGSCGRGRAGEELAPA